MIGHSALQKPSVLLTTGVFGGGGAPPLTPPDVSDPDYQAVIDYAFAQGYTLPSAPVRTAQDNLVIALKAAGAWTLMDIFYNFITDGDLNFATLNWKAPASYKCTVMGTTPTLGSLSGVQFDINGNFNTNWIPGTHGVNFTQNSASVFIHLVLSLHGTAYDFGCSPNVDGISSGIAFNSANASGTGAMRINSNTSLSLVSGRNEGIWHCRRTASNANSVVRNAATITSDVVVSVARPTVSMYIGATNGNGTVVGRPGRRYGMFAAGASMSAVSVATNNAWIAYVNPYRAAQVYQAVLDYATSQSYALPSSAAQTLQLALVRALMDYGIWDYLDCFYVFATDASTSVGFTYINWKAPGTFQITAVNAPTFVAKVGYQFNGTNQYLDTNWRPNATQAYLTNDAGFGIYVATNISNGSALDCGCTSSADGITLSSGINSRNASDQCSARINSTTPVFPANTNSIGFYHVRRVGANDAATYKNGTLLGSSASAASGSRTVQDMWIGCSNGNGAGTLWSPRTIGMFWAGAACTAREANFNTAWSTYFTGVSAL